MRNHTVTQLADPAFHALADPTRRAVLDLLRDGSRSAGEIAGSFSTSRPAVSKHLRILRRSKLVHEHRRGRHRFYQLNPEPLQVVDQWLAQYRVFWRGKLASLKAYVESEHAGEKEAARVHKKKDLRSR